MSDKASVTVFERLAALLPIEELTGKYRNPWMPSVVATRSVKVAAERLARILFRTEQPHAIVTGQRGVGKTALLSHLAELAGNGQINFLAGTRFVRIDCANVGPEDSRACLESIFDAVNEELSQSVVPELADGAVYVPDDDGLPALLNSGVRSNPTLQASTGKERWIETSRLVLCLDSMAALLKRPNGGSNKPLLRALMARPGLRVIGVMSDWEYTDLIGGDAAMLDCFARVELEEPDDATALEIAWSQARQLSTEFGCEIDEHVVERAVALTSTFVLNERHPAKALRILRQVCEDAEFTQSCSSSGNGHALVREPESQDTGNDTPVNPVTVTDIMRAVAEKTGLPIETIAGEELEANFEAALRDAVIGQENAIREVAAELRLIKAGLSEPGKPATVLLFAGMTGVGKTELAKRIAELYSTSRKLQVYTMGNYTESHCVSSIITAT